MFQVQVSDSRIEVKDSLRHRGRKPFQRSPGAANVGVIMISCHRPSVLLIMSGAPGSASRKRPANQGILGVSGGHKKALNPEPGFSLQSLRLVQQRNSILTLLEEPSAF